MTKKRSENLIKSFYFFYFAASSAFLPYLALHFEDRGLRGREIGLLSAVTPIVTIFATSIWSHFADSRRKHRGFLVAAVGGTIGTSFGLYFGETLFVLLLSAAIFSWFNAPIIPLADDAALRVLDGERHRYGKLRLWGAVGWGLTAPIIGFIVERLGLNWTFYGFLLLLTGALFCVVLFQAPHKAPSNRKTMRLTSLLANPEWILFMAIVLVAGVGSGMIHHYLFLYMRQLKAGPVAMGLTLTMATIGELIAFYFSERLMKRWSAQRLLLISVSALVLRLLAYSFVTGPWIVLIIQLLHGLTFSMLWIVGVAYANQMAPKGLENTAQGLFSAVYMGLATGLGAMIGGGLYEQFGSLMMFRWTGVGLMIALVMIVIPWKILEKKT